MRPTAHTSLASLATVLLLAAPAAAAPPTPHQLTLSAKPATVLFGKSTLLSGKLTGANSGGVTVTLRDDPYPFGHYNPVGTTTTAADGTYHFTVSPTVNTKYQADAKSKAPATSPEVLVKVAPRVGLRVSDRTPKVGQKVTFFGKVFPPHDGQSVLLQRRRSDGSWRTKATIPLVHATGGYSTYSRKWTVRRNGTFRVVKPADADHARGTSPKRTLTVHG